MLGTFVRFLPIVTQVFLWTAIFASVSESTIGGFSRNDLIAYYLLTMVARAFSSMPGHASSIARSITRWLSQKFLTQPIDWLEFMLLNRMAP